MHNAFPAALAVRLISDQGSDNVPLQPPTTKEEASTLPLFPDEWDTMGEVYVLCACVKSPIHTSDEVDGFKSAHTLLKM